MSEKNKVELCHWVVAFVDLLGQGDKMREVSRLIDSGQEEESVEGMKQIYFDHKRFYEAFRHALISNQGDDVKAALPLPPEISKEEYQAILKRNLKMQVFSDAAMFYLPLVDDGKNQPLFGIRTLLSVLGIQMLSFLAQKRPFRCGIEVGFGLEMEEGKLIGPAVLHAYELESKRAQYPRIVVGDALVEYLQNMKQTGVQKGTEAQKTAAKSLARIGLEMLGTDLDGEIIVDYLGAGFMKKLPKGKPNQIISMAYEFASAEQARYRDEKNSRLAIRYACLATYFATQRPKNNE